MVGVVLLSSAVTLSERAGRMREQEEGGSEDLFISDYHVVNCLDGDILL